MLFKKFLKQKINKTEAQIRFKKHSLFIIKNDNKMVKQITSTEQFPVTPTSAKIVGKRDNKTSILLRIDRVEEYVSDGSYKSLLRVLINNPEQMVIDSFLFDVERGFLLEKNYIVTNEDSMNLLTLYMMAIQDHYDFNKFVIEVVKKIIDDFGFDDVRMIGNKITSL